MKDRFVLFLVTLFVVGVATSSTYAALTGVVTGKISDNAGNAIPGVTVTITGSAMQGDRQDFTNENGVFRLPDLPPGDYTVTAEMMGLKTAQRTGVKVKLNTTTKLNLTMEVAAYEETVVVTAEAVVIDTTSTTQTTNIDREFTEKLPSGGSYQDSMTMVGGTVGASNPQIKGGTKMNNVYLLDGVDTTDTVTGTFASNINPDALEEVEIQTGGFQAEYGRALGGISNAVTKSGGNNFNFIFRLEYNDNTWQDDPFYATTAPEKRTIWTPTLSLGGPIIRDMLWFFITTKYQNVDDSLKVMRDYNDDPTNPSGTVDTSDEGIYPYFKLTFQPTAAHKFIAKYNAEIRTIYGYDADTKITPEATADWEQGGPFFGLDWTWLFSQNTYLTTQIAYHHGFLNHFPKDENLSRTSYNDAEDGVTWGAPDSYQYNDRDRNDLKLSLNHFIDEWIGGSHDLKVGFEYQQLMVKEDHGIPSGRRYVYNGFQSGTDNKGWDDNYYFDSYTEISGGRSIEYDGNYIALYGQDGFEVQDGLTVNFGLRAETMKFENDTGRVKTESFNRKDFTAKQSYQDSSGDFTMAAPRLGVAWDVTNDGKTKLHCFLGRYYNPLNLQVPGMLLETSPTYTTYRRRLNDDGRGDYGNRPYDSSPDNKGNTWDDWRDYETTGGEENTGTLDSNLKPEYSDEIQLGAERELAANVSLGLAFTYRDTKNLVEDVGVWRQYYADSGEWTGRDYLAFDVPDGYRDDSDYDYELDHYYVTNPEGAKRRYAGLELTLNTRTENLTLLASYTYSVVKGSVTGDQPTDAGGYSGSGTVSNFSVYYDTPELCRNVYGNLPYDVDHYFKINASYDFFKEDWYAFSLGTSYFYRTGYAYDRRTIDPTYGGQYNLEEYGRGSYRLPAVSFMDLSVQKHFPFSAGKYGTLSVIFNIDNVFSSEYLLSRTADDKGPNRPWTFDQNGGHAAPRSYTLSFKYEI